MKTVAKRLAFLLPLIIVWAIPATLVVFAFQKVGPTESEALSMPLPETVDVGARERNFTQPVSFTLKFEEEPAAILGASGTVTKINFEPGEKIKQGDALLTVDGITLRAHRGTQPFHRDLTRGDKGDDVRELAAFLSDALAEEIKTDTGDKFGYRLSEAVKKYQRANGAPVTGSFEKGYVVYLTDEITHLGSPTVRLGDQVELGSDFATPAEAVASAKIESQEGAIKAASVAGPYELAFHDTVIELDELDIDREKAVEIYELLLEAGLSLTEGEDTTERSFTNARVAIQNPLQVGSVAPSAIYASPSGALCIFEAHQKGEVLTGSAIPLSEASGLEGDIAATAIDFEHAGKTVIRVPETLPESTLAKCA